jgi:hypothetical protein
MTKEYRPWYTDLVACDFCGCCNKILIDHIEEKWPDWG